MLCPAAAIDVSKWSYDDLSQTAMEKYADGNYKGALIFFDKAVQAAPNNPEGYLNRGGVFELLHQSDKAIQDERQAIVLAQGSSPDAIRLRSLAHQNLAGIYLDNKQIAKAESEARTAIQICPNLSSAQETLGNILVETGRITDALPYYRKAKEIYEQGGLPQEAAKMNDKILQLQSKLPTVKPSAVK